MASSPNEFLGSLSEFKAYDVTTNIGTKFPEASVQLSQLLKSSKSDEYVKDLAHLVSQRGVVFFTHQDMTIEDQKELITRMGTLTGKPKSSTLHKHPIHEAHPELGEDVTVISSEDAYVKTIPKWTRKASKEWHTDITFEKVPSDYTMLKLHTLPAVGGDTLWASGYAAYDKFSPAYQKFLEGLTAVHHGLKFETFAKANGITMPDNRGSPENSGNDLRANHPVIRTHPVTGFKSLFVNQGFTVSINDVTPDESDSILDYLWRHVSENHDIQVRYRWSQNDVAIWDNRCTFHSATFDYDGKREGNRVVGIGERPYFDPASKSRKEVLGI